MKEKRKWQNPQWESLWLTLGKTEQIPDAASAEPSFPRVGTTTRWLYDITVFGSFLGDGFQKADPEFQVKDDADLLLLVCFPFAVLVQF